MMRELRRQVNGEIFDYQILKDALAGYAAPRDHLTILLKKGDVIRVKKGLYVFGEDWRRRPYPRELLANLIYGPSFVSLDYALAYYGLIPERVEAVTSVTAGRSRRFYTPLGLFTYRTTPCFYSGFVRIEENQESFLMALPERALADSIRADRGAGTLNSEREAGEYLLENRRLDPDGLRELDTDYLAELAHLLRSRKIKQCTKLIISMR